MNICERCREVIATADCIRCEYGNPCLGCTDYNEATDTCISNGGCAIPFIEQEQSSCGFGVKKGISAIRCSICGEITDFKHPYCSYCGAKMDEEVDYDR